jgi:hypothetical protein
MMNSWGMDGVNGKENPKPKQYMTLKQIEESGSTIGESQYMDTTQALADEKLINIGYKAINLVLREEEEWPFVWNSGVIRTGRPANNSRGQECHADNKNILTSELFLHLAKGEKEVKRKEMEKWGWNLDVALTESGRMLKIAIPDATNKRFVIKTVFIPYGCMMVRHMSLLHAGHGGECGNTSWHGHLLPKGGPTKFFDEEHLGYGRMLASDRVHGGFFLDWKFVWEEEQKRNRNQKDWMDNCTVYKKRWCKSKAASVWQCYMDIAAASLFRWMCSPNMARDGAGMIARGKLTNKQDKEETAENMKHSNMKLKTFSKAIEDGEGVGFYGMNGKVQEMEMQVKNSENGMEEGMNVETGTTETEQEEESEEMSIEEEGETEDTSSTDRTGMINDEIEQGVVDEDAVGGRVVDADIGDEGHLRFVFEK